MAENGLHLRHWWEQRMAWKWQSWWGCYWTKLSSLQSVNTVITANVDTQTHVHLQSNRNELNWTCFVKWTEIKWTELPVRLFYSPCNATKLHWTRNSAVQFSSVCPLCTLSVHATKLAFQFSSLCRSVHVLAQWCLLLTLNSMDITSTSAINEQWLVEQGLTSHSTQFRSFWRRCFYRSDDPTNSVKALKEGG